MSIHHNFDPGFVINISTIPFKDTIIKVEVCRSGNLLQENAHFIPDKAVPAVQHALSTGFFTVEMDAG